MKNSVLVLCTIINVLVAVIALIFVFKVDVTWTGPLGDTFGGLLSPVIGGISIYFIYKTFAAQRKQLEDQIIANHVTMSTLHLEKIEDIMNGIEKQREDFNYTSPNFQQWRGVDFINAFSQRYNSLNERMYRSLSPSDINLINKVLSQVNQFIFLSRIYILLKNELTEEYKLIAEGKISSLLTNMMPVFSKVYDTLLSEVERIPIEDGNLSIDEKNTVNQMVQIVNSFTIMLDELAEAKLIIIRKKVTVSSEELFEPNLTNPWNPTVNREGLRKIDVKRYYSIK